MPLDNPAVTKALTLGARTAGRISRQHHATDVWSETWEGSGHQGATYLPEVPEGGWNSTPLANIPGAVEMQAGEFGNAVAKIGEAQGALATTAAVFGALTAAEQTVSTLVSAIPFPAFPAVRISDYDVGLPHAHSHPPNLVPPAPPVPLPSTGPVIPIPYVSGASTVLINGMPAGRCGDVGMGIWCGGYFPMFEIFLGSSSVWIEGMRAARLGVDITKHCIFSTPKPEDPPLGPPFGMTVSASPNVLIGGVPMPSLSAMAMSAALKAAFKGLSKIVGALKESGIFSRAAAEEAAEVRAPDLGSNRSPALARFPPKGSARAEMLADQLSNAGDRALLPDGITASELAFLTRTTGDEFAVVVKNGDLYLVRGDESAVRLAAGDHCLVHTHPDNFGSYASPVSAGDCGNAADNARMYGWQHPQAVIDRDGNVHAFDQNGVVDNPTVSPVGPDGTIDGLHRSPRGAPFLAVPPSMLN